MTLQILHLEDNPDDMDLVRIALTRGGVDCKIDSVSDRDTYLSALNRQAYDVILSDSGVPGYDGASAMIAAHETCPRVPFIVVSGSVDPNAPRQADLASARISKTELGRLAPVIDQELRRLEFASREELRREFYIAGMQRLLKVAQELSTARDLTSVMEIVRSAARKLVGADGATFILREGERCFYADEDAIAPLWKGERFPIGSCVSGWTMLNSRPAIIRDIYQDVRIEHGRFRPTFVKSLIMMPMMSGSGARHGHSGGESGVDHQSCKPGVRRCDTEHANDVAGDAKLQRDGAGDYQLSSIDRNWLHGFGRPRFPVTLNQGQSATLNVQFDPTTTGAASGQLDVIQSDSSTNSTAVVKEMWMNSYGRSGGKSAVDHQPCELGVRQCDAEHANDVAGDAELQRDGACDH